jgi:hypothetical protein
MARADGRHDLARAEAREPETPTGRGGRHAARRRVRACREKIAGAGFRENGRLGQTLGEIPGERREIVPLAPIVAPSQR